MRNLLKTITVLTLLIAFPASAPAASNEETFRQLELFGDIFERVRSFYVDETADKELIEEKEATEEEKVEEVKE